MKEQSVPLLSVLLFSIGQSSAALPAALVSHWWPELSQAQAAVGILLQLLPRFGKSAQLGRALY